MEQGKSVRESVPDEICKSAFVRVLAAQWRERGEELQNSGNYVYSLQIIYKSVFKRFMEKYFIIEQYFSDHMKRILIALSGG